MTSFHKEPVKRVSADVAGAGGGTLFVMLASTLPDHGFGKEWLMLLAPSLTVILGAVWLWLQVRVANHFSDRGFDATIRQARTAFSEILGNPDTSDEHRARIRREIERVELLVVARHVERLQAFKVVGPDGAPVSPGGEPPVSRRRSA